MCTCTCLAVAMGCKQLGKALLVARWDCYCLGQRSPPSGASTAGPRRRWSRRWVYPLRSLLRAVQEPELKEPAKEPFGEKHWGLWKEELHFLKGCQSHGKSSHVRFINRIKPKHKLIQWKGRGPVTSAIWLASQKCSQIGQVSAPPLADKWTVISATAWLFTLTCQQGNKNI